MTSPAIDTDVEYRAALNEIERLMPAHAGTSDGERLDALVAQVEAYERIHFPMDQAVSGVSNA